MESFDINIGQKYGDDEEGQRKKLTYLLQYCTGDAKELLKDIYNSPREQRLKIATSRLKEEYGQEDIIARAYIKEVTECSKLRASDIDGLKLFARNMKQCENTLSNMEFSSDLDSTGTLDSVVLRLPQDWKNRWKRQASKIQDQRRLPKFKDFMEFVI
jgi:hypothetical protein